MRFYGRDEMQIVQTLETINVNTDDINVFQYFKDLITKNFTKVVGRKNKIFLFLKKMKFHSAVIS